MITGYSYRYFLAFITVFALYQLVFFYLIRPYYHKHIAKGSDSIKIPEVAFEVLYLLILVLGLAVAPYIDVSPYYLWAAIFCIYGLAIKYSHTSFFLASALIFKIRRDLDPQKQLGYQTNIIVVICIVSGLIFTILGNLL